MAGLADWLENYRNWRGRQEWEQGKGWQDFFGGDPRAQEQFEKLSGFGTDAGGLVGMIKASHGSPHAFTKFDFSKIGTGEGAQAYGHGGYFAQGFDSPTAKEYQKQLAADVQLKGQPFYSGKSGKQLATTGNPELDDYLMANLGDVGAARANLLADLRDVRSGGGDVKDYQRTLADLRNIRGDVENTDLGHLYNVELRWPDAAREAADPLGEHHLLDWDAPISEQPETVQKAWEKFLSSKAAQSANKSMRGDLFEKKGAYASPTGSDIYGALTEGLIGYGKPRPFMQVKQEASERLRKAGIPGIRYLDQGSRVTSGGDLVDVFKGPQGWHSKIKVTNRSGAGFSAPTDSFTTSMPFKTEQEARDWAASKIGAGTRNYVMFDDALANIVSRNGVSLSDLLQNQQQLKSLNPTGSVFAGYNPTARASLPLGENLTTLSETMGVSPDELITIYRGVPHDVSTINPGDFITTNQQLAKDYAGTGKVISQKVKASDILDDLNESLGEEYIYRPGLKKLLKK